MTQPSTEPVRRFIIVEADDPRLHIMISSTTMDLPDHRREVSEAILRMGHTPVMMEFGSAEWNSDAIKFSLEKVEKSQVYIGIFALRYGYIKEDSVRNPDRLSVTELEYRHALKLGIPTLIYVAKKTHPFEEEQIDFDPKKREKLNRLKAELGSSGIVGFFNDPAELRSLVLQSLHELQVKPRDIIGPPPPASKIELPRPPAVYAVPEYTLTNTFVGRSSELDLLDKWAQSRDPIMVVDGIGGLGKSAVTWEWMQRRAQGAIPSLAGRVWWSFYEKGTSMVTFVRHALAYVRGQDPESANIKDLSHYERGQQLLAELRKRPNLLVLDGFERVLTAYHRLDKAQIPDEKVDTGLRDCINPPDGELLTQLLGCSPSKILISTRLFPSGLEDRASKKPIPGVIRHELNGLSRPDALELMRQSGVKGDEKAMLAFADQFGRHSLLLRIVCGMIADYRKKPYDFDAWRSDPIYGGGLKLNDVDLKQRQTHILHYALAGLNEPTRRLLSRIAVISEHSTYDTLSVLNPFLPPQPKRAKEPKAPSVADPKYHQAVTEFDAALRELENRGLLQWDRESNRYEMHPVVRAYSAEQLEGNDRTEIFLKVRDHFASLPPDDLKTATELADVARSLEIYRCLVGAGKLDEAASFYRGGLSNTLLFRIGAYSVILELLKPLFRNDLQSMPCLELTSVRSFILNDLAIVYSRLGRDEDALKTCVKILESYIDEQDWREAAINLRNNQFYLIRLDRRAEAAAALKLARELAVEANDEDRISLAILDQMSERVRTGRFNDADALYAEFRQRRQPDTATYRPGDADFWHCTSQFFRQRLTDAEWQAGYDLAVRHRNVWVQHQFLALRAERDLTDDRPQQSLEAIEQALQITNKLGTPRPDYHDLRAWALARVGRVADAHAELAAGKQDLFAAETYLVLNDRDLARECALNAYRWAWGEGPPHVQWYYVERSRALLKQLGEPGPQLPPFDPAKVPPIPFENEIRAAIERLRAERAGKANKNGTHTEE